MICTKCLMVYRLSPYAKLEMIIKTPMRDVILTSQKERLAEEPKMNIKEEEIKEEKPPYKKIAFCKECRVKPVYKAQRCYDDYNKFIKDRSEKIWESRNKPKRGIVKKETTVIIGNGDPEHVIPLKPVPQIPKLAESGFITNPTRLIQGQPNLSKERQEKIDLDREEREFEEHQKKLKDQNNQIPVVKTNEWFEKAKKQGLIP